MILQEDPKFDIFPIILIVILQVHKYIHNFVKGANPVF